MSVEGGNWKCDITGFHTSSIKKWNEHATEECDLHTETGSTACISCGERVEYEHIPFRPLAADGSKNFQLQCDDCMDAMKGKTKKDKDKGAKK